jgi:hypothetical protein
MEVINEVTQGDSKQIEAMMADGKWQMADGRWQMADGSLLSHNNTVTEASCYVHLQ